MNTIEKLAKYKSELTKWVSKKHRHDLAEKEKRPIKKPLESEPLPSQFEIGAGEIEWAEKIRRAALEYKPFEPTPIEEVKTVKLPTRKKL